ncbi:hypothetical protein EVG20_g1942 [Dentipellis fragilis]|uniref:Uncharacterized protein n=1 Tax=Dentipellis fragilis TaxID=205917 RepID=A0A4Y9Z9D9_9AGAM|nr:hypothetical protein EVG20_g1942 [Dentipellis fragilis]
MLTLRISREPSLCSPQRSLSSPQFTASHLHAKPQLRRTFGANCTTATLNREGGVLEDSDIDAIVRMCDDVSWQRDAPALAGSATAERQARRAAIADRAWSRRVICGADSADTSEE